MPEKELCQKHVLHVKNMYVLTLKKLNDIIKQNKGFQTKDTNLFTYVPKIKHFPVVFPKCVFLK